MPDTTIDLRLGEARSIRDITCKLFDLEHFNTNINLADWEYQASGHKPLVKLLEDKYGAPVVITNGAIQALHAVMYALKIKGFNNIGVRAPYWNRIPEIAQYIGIGFTPFEGNFFSENKSDIDSYLLTMPNNPDGYLPPLDVLRSGSAMLRELDIPLIHDAVYYTRTYLPIDYPIEPIGDVQLFSASKTYGLSGLRVGYMVVHNQSFYKSLMGFMDFSTVGVSIAAQKLLLHILQRKEQLPFLVDNFHRLTREEVKKTKNLLKDINPDYVGLPDNFERNCGMFGWVKPKLPNLFEKIGINVLDGSLFGMDGYCRLNLGAGSNFIAETVRRINNV